MVKKDIIYSKWKLNAAAQLIRGGKSLIDAKNALSSADKKGCKFIEELLNEVEDRGVKKGYNPE